MAKKTACIVFVVFVGGLISMFQDGLLMLSLDYGARVYRGRKN